MPGQPADVRRRHGERPAVIEARGLVKDFRGDDALKGVDLSIRAGELFGLIGPDGAGKTTFFRLVAGLLDADVRHRRARARRARSGSFRSASRLYEDLSIDENLRAARAALRRVPDEEARPRAVGPARRAWASIASARGWRARSRGA